MKSGARKQASTKKSPAVRAVAKKAAAKATVKKPPVDSSYKLGKGGIYIPASIQTPVAPSKIRSGLLAAKEQLADMIDELVEFSGKLSVSEIELQVSFTADGKFLGVGVGGATSIKLRITPND